MFHSFTGCDTTSSFAGKGKKTAWDTWAICPEITDVFSSLMSQPTLTDVDNALETIEKIAVLMFNKTSSENRVNVVRLKLFTQKGRDIMNIPPTQGALIVSK